MYLIQLIIVIYWLLLNALRLETQKINLMVEGWIYVFRDSEKATTVA